MKPNIERTEWHLRKQLAGVFDLPLSRDIATTAGETRNFPNRLSIALKMIQTNRVSNQTQTITVPRLRK